MIDVLYAVLVPHLLLKLIAIGNAMRWFAYEGGDYIAAHARLKRNDDRARLAFMEQYGGTFFPFGAKDYTVRRRYMRWRARGGGWRVLGDLLWLWTTVLFTAPGLVGVGVLAIVLPPFGWHSAPYSRWLALVVAVLATAIALAIYFESVTWYVTVRRYAHVFFTVGFHRTPVRNFGELIAEVRVYIYVALAVLVSSSALCFVAASLFDAYRYADGALVDFSPKAVMSSCFHVASTSSLLGESQFRSNNSLGGFLGVVFLGEGVILVLFGIGIILGIFGGLGGGNRRGTPR